MIVKFDGHIYADISTTHKSEVSKKAIHIDPLTTGYSTDPNKRKVDWLSLLMLTLRSKKFRFLKVA